MAKRKWININGKWRIVPNREDALKGGVKFIPCSEDTQVFNWQRTDLRSKTREGVKGAYVPRTTEDVKKQKNKNV